VSGPQIRVRTRKDLVRQRRSHGHQCWDHLVAAPLWPMHGANLRWLRAQRSGGTRIVGIELADEAVRLADLPAARQRTVAVLGHERTGIPPEAVELLDVAVEIPMIGIGASLNVAVAGSLVLYRLAGFI
jgi:tRNA (guanosine-2'-O-)-methyltransferase